MLSEKLMASVRFPNLSKAGMKSFSEEQENVLTYILKYEKELNFVWRKIIQGVPSSEDERRQLQEIFAAELQQFAITCVLGLWERKMPGKNSCLYNKKKITRCLEDRNLFFRGEKEYFTHSSKAFDRPAAQLTCI